MNGWLNDLRDLRRVLHTPEDLVNPAMHLFSGGYFCTPPPVLKVSAARGPLL